jgi:fatty acid omega-hydroxylase
MTLPANASDFFALTAWAVGLFVIFKFFNNSIWFMDEKERKFWSIPKPPFTLPFLKNTIETAFHLERVHDWFFNYSLYFKGKPWRWGCLGRPDAIVFSSVEAFEDIEKCQFENFEKGYYFNGNMEDLAGHGIFAVDGDQWVHQRKIASNLFTLRTLRDYMATAVRFHAAQLSKMIRKSIELDTPLDLFKVFNRFTIETFVEIAFGVQLECMEREKDHPFQAAFDSAQQAIFLRFFKPIWLWKLERFLRIGTEYRLRKSVEVIDTFVYKIISEALQMNEKKNGDTAAHKRNTLISLFLNGSSTQKDGEDNDGSKQAEINPKELRDIVLNFILAGRDTTAQALSWFFVSLSRHPSVEEKIRKELHAKLPGLFDGSLEFPNMQQCGDLVYLEAALKETLRLYPSVPLNIRLCVKDTTLSDGTFIKSGTVVAIPSYGLARMTSVWGPDASEYKPERWIDEKTGKLKMISSFQFNSFHAGPRMCLGINLAMMEMKIVTSGLLSKYHFDILNKKQITYGYSLTLPIKGALMTKVTPTC